ncbi:MAG: hypothetical protein FWC16_08950 [Defluviitaleaceae bacterium]|nr:hypothetical protein [Defluviitaleaceae bacterium]MCL2275037.1 hypothetical protein [Defluviitaleaceae bacterium]
MQCYVHEQKSAVGACVGCGKFICAECVTEVSGKSYCKNCVNELVASKNKELEKMENKVQNQNPMVFMNAGGGASSSSSSSAAAASGGMREPFPRQSILVHLLLLLFTAGIGNIIYFLYIRNRQNQWYAMY